MILTRTKNKIDEFKASGKNHLIITDPMMCYVPKGQIRFKLLEWFDYDAEITFYAFENDVLEAWINVQQRNDDRIISKKTMIEMYQSYLLNIIDYKELIPVYSRNNP